MQVLSISKTLVCIFRQYTKILLTLSLRHVHTSRNTPAKPMLFPNSMLKLCGLFFACYLLTSKYTTRNTLLSLKGLLEGAIR